MKNLDGVLEELLQTEGYVAHYRIQGKVELSDPGIDSPRMGIGIGMATFIAARDAGLITQKTVHNSSLPEEVR